MTRRIWLEDFGCGPETPVYLSPDGRSVRKRVSRGASRRFFLAALKPERLASSAFEAPATAAPKP